MKDLSSNQLEALCYLLVTLTIITYFIVGAIK